MKSNLFYTVSGIAAVNPLGFTFNCVNGEMQTKGFAVACAETQNSFGDEGLARVLSFVESKKNNSTCVGGWLDKNTGLYYFDAVIICESLDEALEIGKANNQIAIFDLDTFTEIRL